MPNFWLMKSEPEAFSIEDLQNRPRQTEPWDGVRNYQARNTLWREMQPGDPAFFYHSSCKSPGIVGVAEIVGGPEPDPSQFNPASKYYDPQSPVTSPRWFLRHVRFVQAFPQHISLEQLKTVPEWADSPLLQRGNRLSILPVTAKQWAAVMARAILKNIGENGAR